MKTVLVAFGILSATVGGAGAFCSEPYGKLTLPDAPGSYGRPNVPYCLSGYKWSGKHECDDWELDSYKREVSNYIDQLNTYVNEANEVARKAQRFAQEAYDYATCEADEVASQHR